MEMHVFFLMTWVHQLHLVMDLVYACQKMTMLILHHYWDCFLHLPMVAFFCWMTLVSFLLASLLPLWSAHHLYQRAPCAGVRIHWGLSHPYQTIKTEDSPIPWNDVACVLWFPKFDSNSDNLEGQKSLVQTLFEYLAIRLMSDALLEVQAILIMNNIRFSQLQVLFGLSIKQKTKSCISPPPHLLFSYFLPSHFYCWNKVSYRRVLLLPSKVVWLNLCLWQL